VTFVALAAALPGCMTGHLLDAARRRERPVVVTGAGLDGDRLLVRYTVEVSDDAGHVLDATEGAAAVPLVALRATAAPGADAVAVARIAPARVARGQPVSLVRAATGGSGACAGPSLEVVETDGRDVALLWHDGGGAAAGAPLPTAALTQLRIAPWVWPLVPATLAVDAVATPVLLFFAPAVLLIGE
jgi:hypothetical protein